MAKRITIYTDGAAQPNPGPAGVGVVILDESGAVIFEASHSIGYATNNQAEYKAVIKGLEEAARLRPEHIEVRSDSELLVKQIKGEYRVKNPGLKPLFQQIHQLIKAFPSFSIVHIPRTQNKAADALSRKALRRT
ncbi:MAG: ribonuclease HI family protein [Dehalococcoidia bacterium]